MHTAVAARKTRDEAQVAGEETRKIHSCAEREAIGSAPALTPETRQDREQNERCWWNELPGTGRERLEAEIRARPYEPVRGLDGEVLVAAISDLEVIRIAWEEAHPDRPRWQKLPEEAFRNRYPRSDPGSGQELPPEAPRSHRTHETTSGRARLSRSRNRAGIARKRGSSPSLFRVRAIIRIGRAPEARSVVFQPTLHRPITNGSSGASSPASTRSLLAALDDDHLFPCGLEGRHPWPVCSRGLPWG